MATRRSRANKPLLMSQETEYSVSGTHRRVPLAPEKVSPMLLAAIRKERIHLPDVNGSGFYLSNGARHYQEINGHPEVAQPEAATPLDVVLGDKAAERILQQAQQRVMSDNPGWEVRVAKNNIGAYSPNDATWGTHSSFACWVSLQKAANQLVPHLVSSLPFAGSGCLSEDPAGCGFELSQRARHLVHVTGADTTQCRAIFCTRVRKRIDSSRDGCGRAHLIWKDAARHPFGVYLTYGSTGLLFDHINQGRTVGKGLALADPVAAIRHISRDPWLRASVLLADGRTHTALEIQECYLAECEKYAQRGQGPAWAADVLRHWRNTLEGLAKDPLSLAPRLDAYLKLALYEHERARHGYQWTQLRDALRLLRQLRQKYPEHVMRAIVDCDAAILRPPDAAAHREAVANLKPQARQTLRFIGRMQVLEFQYHTLGGLYDQLEHAGLVENELVTPQAVETAMVDPPPGSRATIRGACVKAHHREPGWLCDWRYVRDTKKTTAIDLRDPFETECKCVNFDELS